MTVSSRRTTAAARSGFHTLSRRAERDTSPARTTCARSTAIPRREKGERRMRETSLAIPPATWLRLQSLLRLQCLFFSSLYVVKVASYVFAVSAGVPVRTGRRKPILCLRHVHEPDFSERVDEIIIRRVIRRLPADYHIFLEDVRLPPPAERRQTYSRIGPDHPVGVVRHDVVREHQPHVQHLRRFSRQDVAGREPRVVVYGHVFRPADNLEQLPVTSPRLAVNVFDQVISDQYPPRRQATARLVVRPRDVEPAPGMPHHVVAEGHILRHRPRRPPALIARREQDRETILALRPVVLEDVRVDQCALRGLQLEEVLHRPPRSRVRGVAQLPLQRLHDVVVAELDVGRDQVLDGGVRAAEEEVLPSALEVVIDDLEWARAVPPGDGLRVRAGLMTLRDVRVDDGGRGAVERDAAAGGVRRVAVDVAAVDD